MSNTRNVGPSITKLELANNSALEQTNAYKAAKREYDIIINNAINYIQTHAPVIELILSRNAYKNGKDLYNASNPSNVLYLSAKSISGSYEATNGEYISTHTITPMLRYILQTEGWTSYDSKSYHIDITRNGNIAVI